MRRLVPHSIFLGLTLASLAWSVPVALLLPLPDGPSDYNAPAFVVRYSWVNFARAATATLRDDLSEPEKDARIARFFELNRLIAEQERIAGDAATDPGAVSVARAEGTALRAERADIENSVEEILEQRLTTMIKEQGLTRHIAWDVVWPPVNIEFEEAPAVLVESPRREIRRAGERLVRGDLTIEERLGLEAKAEADGATSALVVDIGAIALYPALVPPAGDYHSTLQTVAHEWVHHYLYFAPLGRNFYDGDKLVTLNETVANIVGDEVGDLVFERWPLAQAPAFVSRETAKEQGQSASLTQDLVAKGRTAGVTQTRFFAELRMTGADGPLPNDAPATDARRSQAEFDFGQEMRGLRAEVDALLAAGRVEEAERLMEERRQVFVANGYRIRRINQAYFAFHGSYADTPASSDPIGPKMAALREQSRSVKEFLERAREITSEAGLDAVLNDRE